MTDGPTNPPPVPPPPPPPGAPAPSKSLFERAKDILTSPAREWPIIDAEATSVGRLITGYAVILALIAPLAMLLGLFLTPLGAYLTGAMGFLLKVLLITYGVSLGTVLLLGLAINLLAPTLGGTQNSVQAMKLAVYSGTAFWIAAVILILPDLWLLWLALGVGYGGYLLWLGLPTLMKVPADKAQAYAGAAIGIWVVLFFLLWTIGRRIMLAGLIYSVM